MAPSKELASITGSSFRNVVFLRKYWTMTKSDSFKLNVELKKRSYIEICFVGGGLQQVELWLGTAAPACSHCVQRTQKLKMNQSLFEISGFHGFERCSAV
jgi:hypothetical protein